jgi:predicted dehydrogenase
MNLQWHGSWEEAPCYSLVPRGRLVEIEVTRPLARLSRASGRVLRSPRRKVWRFLLTDGPRATYRKASTKLRERRYSGDYRIVALAGRLHGAGTPVVALACRVPPAADYLLVHEALAHPAPALVSAQQLETFAALVESEVPDIETLGHQSFLYSGDEPPGALVEAVHRAASALLAGAEPKASVTREIVHVPKNGSSTATAIWRTPLRLADRQVPVALLGAGDYARGEILPALERAEVARVAVADREPHVAAFVARERDFALATSDALQAIEALPRPGVVFVATYHDSHARLAAAALSAGHGVFLEKPAVVTEDDLELLVSTLAETGARLEVGFNRRYSELVRRAHRLLAREDGPVTVTCVVKEVELEPNHWYLWPNQGTRVTGNLCHWIDLGVFLVPRRASPTTVTASPPVDERRERFDEERTLAVTFDDGSLLSIVATGRGDDILGVQELVQARRGRLTVTIDDLRRLTAMRDGAARRSRTPWRDKGHTAMFRECFRRLATRELPSYPLRDLVRVAVVQIAASELVRQGETQRSVVDEARYWLGRVKAESSRSTGMSHVQPG